MVRLRYFAMLRETAGCAEESLTTDASTLAELYAQLQSHHGFTLSTDQLRVARNGEFAQWDDALEPDDEVAFIPPVAGG